MYSGCDLSLEQDLECDLESDILNAPLPPALALEPSPAHPYFPMGQYGYLIPDRYVREVPNDVDMNTSSIFWGFSLCAAVFTTTTASQQTWRAWKRHHRVTAYVGMVWAVWISSMVLGCLAWGFQRQYIDPSFGYYFSVAFFWALQVQFLLQIIINRLGLLMVVPGRATRLKWVVFAIVLAVNISVFIIWMPARLQINDRWIQLNKTWDRCEKVIFAIIDGFLNAYFIHLVRSRLIENGLTKYTPLYRMNLFLIFVSLSLDVGLVGLMSLRSSLVYLSFHPVAYLLKLQIEMKMAELITRIVRSSGAHGNGTGNSDMYYTSTNNGRTTGTLRTRGKTPPPLTGTQGVLQGSNTTHVEAGSIDHPPEMAMQGNANLNAILRTIQTTVATSPAHKASVSESNKTHSRTNSTSALAF